MMLLLLKAMRPHQWVKNLLLFAPFVLAHEIRDSEKYPVLLVAFACMCLMASGIYLLNDLFDAAADRLHPDKKHRPIASGVLSPQIAVVAASAMIAASLLWGWLITGWQTAALLAGYGILSLIYTIKLKKILMIDVIVLSFFYTLRVMVGGVAAGVKVSEWFLAFSFFFFLSLAFVKRYTELRLMAPSSGERLRGRGYGAEDMQLMPIAGIATGLLSVLVFLLYIASSEQVKALYTNPLWLWMIAPVFVYWLMRIWFLAQRDLVHTDPVTFAIKDAASWIAAAAIGALLLFGSLT